MMISARALGALFVALCVSTAFADVPKRTLPTVHIRPVVTSGQAQLVGALPENQRLALSIALPLSNEADLKQLLQVLYNPGSPRFRHFMSVKDFTDRFGPSETDYDSLIAFLTANSLSVTGTAANRQIVRIEAAVADIERVFHVEMRLYRHPTEPRNFFAPDREPSVDLDLPLWHIGGLDDYSPPRPNIAKSKARDAADAAPLSGSGPGGSWLASDMRAAYYGNGPLTGAGQAVALFEFGAYLPSDLTSYFATTRQTNEVPITDILLDGKTLCSTTCNDGEPVVDIVQTIGMAPGLSALYVYLGNSEVDILNQIASDDLAKQISISYAWYPADPSSDDPIFEEFAAQGQTVFVASGDCGAYVTGVPYDCTMGVGQMPPPSPQEDPYVTTVGGTVLSTSGPNGTWTSETGWQYSGGGYADGIAIPAWQVAVVDGSNDGSSTLRNVPDVAAEASTDNYNCRDGICVSGGGGTSYAAPRWAGFMALVNEQAALNGTGPVGFLNPTLYAIGTGASYAQGFHDITSGSNTGFSAVAGYDLVTGWGSPNGPALINQLASPPALVAAVEPSSRSVQTSKTATVFATMINAGPDALTNCRISLLASAPTGLALTYQTTDPRTNAPTGTPNTPATLAGDAGAQTFLLSFAGTTGFSAPGLPLDFGCDGTAPAVAIPGVDTIDLAISDTPVPDIVALAATITNDGIVHVTSSGGAFAVATSNAGAAAQITAALDTGGSVLPVVAGICQTDPDSGQCLAPPAVSVAINSFSAGATPTFSIFLTATGTVPFNPASNRLFVRFLDASGAEHGATSVAIETD
jgi:hypothetical protein